jgi:hypothetical protein
MRDMFNVAPVSAVVKQLGYFVLLCPFRFIDSGRRSHLQSDGGLSMLDLDPSSMNKLTVVGVNRILPCLERKEAIGPSNGAVIACANPINTSYRCSDWLPDSLKEKGDRQGKSEYS